MKDNINQKERQILVISTKINFKRANNLLRMGRIQVLKKIQDV